MPVLEQRGERIRTAQATGDASPRRPPGIGPAALRAQPALITILEKLHPSGMESVGSSRTELTFVYFCGLLANGGLGKAALPAITQKLLKRAPFKTVTRYLIKRFSKGHYQIDSDSKRRQTRLHRIALVAQHSV